MKRKDLLEKIDKDLIDKLYGFCYRRCMSRYDAEELCSDILYAVVKAAHKEGEIENAEGFIMTVARRVYADYAEKRREKREKTFVMPEDGFEIADEEKPLFEEDDENRLAAIFREIAFLSRSYREVMILFYLEGKSTSEIAATLGIKETTVRQRLFSARNTVREEVTKMETIDIKKKIEATPMSLRHLNLDIWGNGYPGDGDPRDVAHRQLSKHIIWLCRKKPRSAAEISEELNLPMPYVEEELEIQVNGTNGRYGMLRKLDNGKYFINCILLDKEEMLAANKAYEDYIPLLVNRMEAFIKEHEAEYLAFPYLNKTVTLNLVLWQQIRVLSGALAIGVQRALADKYFADVEESSRPFSVFGYESIGKTWGGGWDSVDVREFGGKNYVKAENLYMTRLRKHFSAGHDFSHDELMRLAVKAIDGISVDTLDEEHKEYAAKAIECGYLYRDGDMLYTKILVLAQKDRDDLFKISSKLIDAFAGEVDTVAAALAPMIRALPAHLHGDWKLFNDLADMPLLDTLVEEMISRGILTPPENGIGAEGCWLSVE